MGKKLLCGILAALLLLSLCPLTALAEGEDTAAAEITAPTPAPEPTPAPTPEPTPLPAEAPEEEVPLHISTPVAMARYYDMCPETGELYEVFRGLSIELAYCLEQTRRSVLPLNAAEVRYEKGEAGYLDSLAGVAAVFAVRMGWERPDQQTLDAESIALLRKTFWGMVSVYPVLEEDRSLSGACDETGRPLYHTERTLRIHVSVHTAEGMAWRLGFTEEQRERAMALEADGSVRRACSGRSDAAALLEEYRVELSPTLPLIRRRVVEAALSLVGRLSYCWGGKPLTTDWNEHWNVPAVLDGNAGEDAGTIAVRGLDCSGFVGWAYGTAAGDIEAALELGFGTSAQWQNSREVEPEELRSGDLVWLSLGGAEASHIGIFVGWDDEGRMVVCHCNAAGGVELSALDGCESCRVAERFFEKYNVGESRPDIKRCGSGEGTQFLKGAKIG